MRVAIYCRVSTTDQNAENQRTLCMDYCQRMGYEVTHVYTDEGISGMKDSRPAFNDLLTDMRRNRFGAIVVTKLDRIGRSLKHILSMFEEFKLRGVQFIAVTQNIDTSSAAGQLQMHIIGAFAEFERNIISERTKEGLVGKLNVGKRGKDKRKRKKRGFVRQPYELVNR